MSARRGLAPRKKRVYLDMAGDKKGFKTQKPMIAEEPKTKRAWNIPWGWVAVLVATPFIFQKCSENDAPEKRWVPNKDTAPAALIHQPQTSGRATAAPHDRYAGDQSALKTQAPSRTAQHRQNHEARLQEQALTPTAESEARRAGFNAIFKSLYKLPAAITGEIDRVMAHRPGDKAIYDIIQVDRAKQFHIAAAAVGADKTINSFVCVQQGIRAEDFFHAQARPDGHGGYEVKISDTLPHPGNYLTGQNLMEAFGQKNCEDGLRRLHSAMNGTGETDALNTYKHIRESERRYNDLGLKAPQS